MTVTVLDEAPNLAKLYARAAVTARGRGGDLPEGRLARKGVAVDPPHLAAYTRVCGLPLNDALPATYPHLLTFPLQMALVAAAIGNGGVEMQPRLVTEARDPTGQVIAEFAPQEFSQPLSAANAAALTQMMIGVVESGTGTAAQIPGVTVAGKTGTAQHGEGANPHAWFVSFAPAEAPEVAVAVIVLDGGSLSSEATGGQLAAPIARAVLEAALGA